ncbi:DMT family transporter [Candidatus Saccharibacteria bacterium TM7i]|nr:DMT family transporter [Candidatus Saccharibacteria bacterium TM7i]
MNKTKTMPHLWKWQLLAVLPALLAAPNGMFVKIVTDDVSAVWLNVLRFFVSALIVLPFVIMARRRFTKKNLKYAVFSGLAYGVAVLSYTQAISLSQASYVSVINLGIPIFLMVYSVYFTKERVSRRALLGISFAALGSFIVVAAPLLFSGGVTSTFHPLATILALVNCAFFPLSVIMTKKANEEGLPISASFGVSSTIIFLLSLFVALVTGIAPPVEVFMNNPVLLLPVLYSAILVYVVAKSITVASYRYIGSVAVGALQYLESFLSIILPIIILGERMTLEMLIGGLLILVGVIVSELKLFPNRKRPEMEAL